MSLVTGTRLGPYEIQSAIGAGGMGEVYKARDTRLDRTVAIKVLPTGLSADSVRRARFEREAKTVAGLNHSHICTLFDVGDYDGVMFLVMEHIVGQTLAERLEKGPLPLEQALTIATEIAEALSAAHRQGVVHRDLKPGNVMLTRAGAKLLDFGLAKLTGHGEQPAASYAVSAVPTQAASLTGQGMIVGTLQYMAPEQLEGKPPDARTDLWALGAVLYEMVTGKRAFEGTSAVSVMSAIMEREPAPIASLQPLMPRALNHVVTTCLSKDPDARWQAAGDVARELRWIAGERLADRNAPQVAGAGLRRRTTRRRVVAGCCFIAAAAILTGWVWSSRNAGTPSPARLVHLTTSPGQHGYPALSPDGKQVAYHWNGADRQNWDIYVKLVGDVEPVRLTSDATSERSACWSPDGARIAFQRLGADRRWAVFTMSAVGRSQQKLTEVPNLLPGMSWSPDGKWLAVARGYAPGGDEASGAGIYLLPLTGGDPVRITSPRPPAYDAFPAFSWDGRSLAFARRTKAVFSNLFVQRLSSSAGPLDVPRQLTTSGAAINGIAWHPDDKEIVFSGESGFMLSYLYRVRVDGEGTPERIEVAAVGALQPSISRVGRRLVFTRLIEDYEIQRVESGGRSIAVFSSSLCDASPDLSADGSKVAFGSSRNGNGTEIWTADVDGTNMVQLTHGPGRNQGSPDWSPDARWLAFDSQAEDGTFDVWVIESGGGQARPVTREPSNEYHPKWSLDGRSLYVASDRSGKVEIWRVPLSAGGWEQMTTEGAELAEESADGTTLFCARAGGPLTARPLAGGAAETVVEYVSSGLFALAKNGIYYWGRSEGGLIPLRLLERSPGRSLELLRVYSPMGLTASPDGNTVFFASYLAPPQQNLVLMEGFR